MYKIALFLLMSFQGVPELIPLQYVVFQSGEHFYIVDYENIYKTKSGQTFETIKHTAKLPHYNFNSVTTKDKTYLISKGAGLVYSFDDHKITRLDHSFDHRNKYYSSLFEYQKKIYSFGGYGLFNNTNNLIFFDDDAKEWYEFNYFSSENHPEPRRLAITSIDNSKLFVVGGFRKTVDAQLKISTEFIEDIWTLDLDSHSWEYLGKTNILDMLEPNLEVAFVKIIPYKGNHLMVTNKNCLLINIKTNTIQKFEGFNSEFIRGASSISFNPASNQFMLTANNHINRKEKLVFISEKDFLTNQVKTYELYTPTNPIFYFLIFGVLISLGLVYIVSKNKETTKEKILKNIDPIKQQLNTYENRILDELLENNELENPYILSFYEPNMSYESKLKKLRLSLNNINTIVSENIGSNKEVIVKVNSTYDKRIRVIKLAKK